MSTRQYPFGFYRPHNTLRSLEHPVASDDSGVPLNSRRTARNLAFVGWASGIFVGAAFAMLLVCRHVTGGRVVYVIDDPAIHLSMAGMLLHHGTWGVQPGVYQSASSAPLWDLLLAGSMWVARTRDILPWLLNMFAGLWLIWAIGSRQRVLRPGLRAPLALVTTGGLVIVVLFMPSLTMVGMEDLLYSAMVVQLVAWLHDRAVGQRTRTPTWAPYGLAALAVVTRFETMWVVAGIGLGYLIDGWVRFPWDRPAIAGRLRTVIWLGLATATPVAVYAGLNRAMGQGFLPNSVLAKTILSGQHHATRESGASPRLFISHLNADPLLAVLLIAAIAYLVAARAASRQSILPAVVLIVAIVAHTVFDQYGNFERYQAYLIALGVYFALSAAGEMMPDPDHPVSMTSARTRAVAVIVLAALLIAPTKWNLLFLTPRGADNTYQQRYQAALFVQRYYQGRPIATSELGYISLLHQGPITDLLGLGDYEVLKHRKNGTDDQAFYADLARRRQFPIAIDYPAALAVFPTRTPASWFLVASWDLREPVVTAYTPLQFWATNPAAARELRADLVDNGHRLPHHVTQVLNPCLEAQLTGTQSLLCPTPAP
jgi:hypothetical protein